MFTLFWAEILDWFLDQVYIKLITVIMKGSSKHTPKPLFLILGCKNPTNLILTVSPRLISSQRVEEIKYNEQTNPYQKWVFHTQRVNKLQRSERTL